MSRRTVPLLLALTGVLALAGCGQRQTRLKDTQPMALRVAVIPPNAGEAPIYAAQATGGLRLAGLAVSLREAADPAAAIKQVESGQADLAVGTTPDLLEARDRGARVQSVAALVRQPLASLISLKPGAPASVGTQGRDYQAAFAHTILKKNSVKIVNVASNPAGALTAKKVDALVGAYSNAEGVDLQAHGKKPRVTAVNSLGVPTYEELIVVANQDALSRDGDAIRSFVGAVARSTHQLNRAEAGPLAGWIAADPTAGKAQALAALKLTLPLMSPPAGRPFGFQQAQDWSGFGRWMQSNGLVKAPPIGPFTNAYLPGAGL